MPTMQTPAIAALTGPKRSAPPQSKAGGIMGRGALVTQRPTVAPVAGYADGGMVDDDDDKARDPSMSLFAPWKPTGYANGGLMGGGHPYGMRGAPKNGAAGIMSGMPSMPVAAYADGGLINLDDPLNRLTGRSGAQSPALQGEDLIGRSPPRPTVAAERVYPSPAQFTPPPPAYPPPALTPAPAAQYPLQNASPEPLPIAERVYPPPALADAASSGASGLLRAGAGLLARTGVGAALALHSGDVNANEASDLARLRGEPAGGPLTQAAALAPSGSAQAAPVSQPAAAPAQFQGNGATGSWAEQPTPQEIERNAGLLKQAKLPAIAAASNAATNRPTRLASAPAGPDTAGYEALITNAMKPDGLQPTSVQAGTVPGGPAVTHTFRQADGTTFSDAPPASLADGTMQPAMTPQQKLQSEAYNAWQQRASDQAAEGAQMPVVVHDGVARIGNGMAVPADVYWQGEANGWNSGAGGGQGRQAIQGFNDQQQQIQNAQLGIAKTGYSPEQAKDLEVERIKSEADIKKAQIAAGGGFGVGGASGTGAGQAGPTGADYLKTIPPALGNQVKGLAEGKIPFPSGPALKTPYWQQMITAVSQYDPSFDAVNYGARAKTRADFTSGKSAQSLNALNTVAGHLEQLSDAADKLNNTSIPLVNTVANGVESALGDPRMKQFEATKKAVVDELTRAYRGSGGSEGDIKSWASTLDAANSPEQLHGVLGTLGELLGSKINALGEQYKQGMGTAGGGIQLVSPKAQTVFDKLRTRAGLEPLPQQGAGAPSSNAPPPAAISHLQANPGLRSAFESKYGVSADAYLGK